MPAMSCATPNARCWWCGTEGAIAIRCDNTARSIDRAFFNVQIEPRGPLSQASEFRIRDTPYRKLDVAAGQSDIAQFTIVQLPQRFDGRPAIQIGDDCVRPNPEPAERSARTKGNCRLGCGLGHRGHRSSPVGLNGKGMPPTQTPGIGGGALGLIACTLLSAISGLIGST
jgi:hypothetical protein